MVQTLDSTAPAKASDLFNVERIRADFPVLHQTVNGKPLIYLDNAASSQVPQVVIDRGSVYLEQEHSNIHRGVHYLSQKATRSSSRQWSTTPTLFRGRCSAKRKARACASFR